MKFEKFALRIALSASFLSAVADRFGLWGAAGESGVSWGNYKSFLSYTKSLNPWASDSMVSILGGAATGLEVVIPVLLLIGFKLRLTSLASAGLLITFALAMTFTGGIKGPLDYSVFTGIAASLLLARTAEASN